MPIAMLAAALLAAQAAPAPTASNDYTNPATWLCLPGRHDACARPMRTTALNANGYGSTGEVLPAADPPADCFYVYPTVSRDPAPNSDMIPGVEEMGVATLQFARFATVCRPFAPLYRQVTLTALRELGVGGAPEIDGELAYDDARDAWRDYLAHRTSGRPFVLIGDSQGSVVLARLLREEIEGKPAAAHMLSAILLGYNVEVPEAKTVGGTFKSTPVCTRVGETGCVVTYVSFPADAPPPAGSLFGRAATPGMTIACTNPATLAAGPAPMDSYWYAGPLPLPDFDTPITWSTTGAPPTPFLRTEGLVRATCVHRGAVGYLSVQVDHGAGDVRTDKIPGRIYEAGRMLPEWGLHAADINIGMGNLMTLIEAQEAAWAARH